MKKETISNSKKSNIPGISAISKIIKSLSLTEKVIFGVAVIIFLFSGITLLTKFNNNFLVEIPQQGGTLREGVIGTPRFINPLLAVSEADNDLVTLIYSGLVRIGPNGEFINDLAESYEVSEDGLQYTFKIREDAKFHDGEEVTAEDVIFTILTAQDPAIKSPKRANWDGIIVEKISEKEVAFILSQPYGPFLLNATLGILPKHIWGNVSAEGFAFNIFNTEPVGSGPYKFNKIQSDSSGIAEYYELERFIDFVLGKPYIKNVQINFYKNESALLTAFESKEINAVNSISPDKVSEISNIGSSEIKNIPLPRIVGVFFNQSEAPILANKTVRSALNASVNKDKIINDVLNGFGKSADTPIPASIIPFETLEGENPEKANSTEEGVRILTEAGWEINEGGFMQRETDDGLEILSFSISTGNNPELIAVAEEIVADWRSIGADVLLKVFDTNDLANNVIRPRKYDALLFGEVIGRDLDFYAFWHSSQRNDPGLNIADYVNINVDTYLEEARATEDETNKIEKLRKFVEEIEKDTPAVFIYSPDLIYIVPKQIKGDIPKNITSSSERFLNIYSWYIETDTVWKIFNRNNNN